MVRVAPINLTFNPRTLWFDPGDLDIEKDMPVVVRTARGTEFGIAASEVIEVSEEQVRALKSALRPVERIATEEDIEQAAEMERASAEALPVFKEMAREYHEDMHPVSVEFLLDGDKAVFYFEAEERIDFRELVRKLAARFHVRIDMRQIGVRDEARMVGGIGHCGQELCCKRLGGEFCPVSIRMAKEQGLSLNPQKISGLCGRLMCCLRYEFDAYKDFKSRAPKLNATVQTPAGPAKVVDHDVPREIVSLKVEGEKPVKVPLSDFDSAPEGATRPNAVGEEAWEEATSDRGLIGGEALIFSTSQFTGADKLAEGFTAKTGIEVEQFQGTTGEILARLEAEAANPVADVVILASWSDGLSMKADDKLESYTPENADLTVDGWLDDDSVLFGYSASAVGVIYNTTVFSTLDADWKDLGNAEYKDQLAIPDPEKSGACKDFVAGYVVKNGWDDFQAMADNGMTVPGANKAALEAVTTGEVGILVAGVDYNAYSSKNKGEPLDIYYPAGGTIVNPRPAMILKTAPNMDNAKAFVDYLFSDEAQQLVANAYLLPGRTDIKCDKRSNLEDIPQITPDWDKMMAEASDDAAKINQICGASNG